MAKRLKVLQELDDVVMEKMGRAGKKAEEIGALENNEKKCKKCLVGIMKEVKPVIEMGELTLHECKNCKEREYL